jgi:hypothetical protein
MKSILVIVALVVGSVAAHAQSPPDAAKLEITARLGTGVEDRELVEEAASFQVGQKAYLWMRFAGGPSDPVTVTWSVGEKTYDVQLEVGGPSWRTWSSKKLWKAGNWSVQVRDAAGASLFSTAFTVRAPTSEMVEDTAEEEPEGTP